MSNDNSHNNFFEDFSKLAGSAMNTAMGSALQAKEQFEQTLKQQIESLLSSMDLVTREEFEVVRQMAEKARKENIALQERIETLEGKKTTKAKKKS